MFTDDERAHTKQTQTRSYFKNFRLRYVEIADLLALTILHLEFCTAAWSPHYVKDKKLLEKVQRRFTRMIPGLKDVPYNERLHILGLWSLEERRIRSDLIKVYKMIHKLSNVNFGIFFVFDTNRSTRGHSLKLKKKRFNTELRQHFFTDSIINLWNSLDEQIVSSTSLNCFKNELEKLRKQHKLMGHAQSCFGYWFPEAEPVPPLVRPRPGELLSEDIQSLQYTRHH